MLAGSVAVNIWRAGPRTPMAIGITVPAFVSHQERRGREGDDVTAA
jgi:hypothetical protein